VKCLCDPGYIQLSYGLEASLDNSDREDTLEKWRVTAHLGEEGSGVEVIPPCDRCTARWDRPAAEGGFVDEDEECPHRLHVGVLELVKVRWGGSQNPFWAMEEESQNLYEIAETVFNDERDGYTEEFEELTEVWGEDLLVLDKAELVEGWRGFGLGPMIAADALRRLAPGCRAVMVHPAPIDATGMSGRGGSGRIRRRQPPPAGSGPTRPARPGHPVPTAFSRCPTSSGTPQAPRRSLSRSHSFGRNNRHRNGTESVSLTACTLTRPGSWPACPKRRSTDGRRRPTSGRPWERTHRRPRRRPG
jgi:hypothetical protein